jgi:hypothetical protein
MKNNQNIDCHCDNLLLNWAENVSAAKWRGKRFLIHLFQINPDRVHTLLYSQLHFICPDLLAMD